MKMTVLEALRAAMAWELENDPDVVVLGEDVGTAGGIFRVTEGLQNRFGRERLIDTPMDEKGIIGQAIGLALFGMRPIAEMQFSGFIHDAHEQIMFSAANYRWISGGEYTVPMVIRAPSFGGIKGGIWHSQSIESYYAHGGGIKIVCPSTPQDAYGMILAAVRDPDPVLVIEPVPLYRALSGDVEDNGVASEIGVGQVVREGSDVTAVTYGPLRHSVIDVADVLAESDGISIEVIDLVSLVPFDIDLVVESVNKTGRLVVIHEACETMGFGAEIATRVQQKSFEYLQAPIERVCAPDVPYSYRVGDEYCRPNNDRISAGLRRSAEYTF